ncbi:MAG TPA: inositol monophosphatase family protein [Allosphingosinicella sp.]
MTSPSPADFLPFARRLALVARAETLPRWRSGCASDDKCGTADYDPVTDADREAERTMRALIEAEYPDHGISGEEFPDRPAQGPWSWSLDPVDGTRSFICGLPNWVTLIALLHEEKPVLGIIDAPCLDELTFGWGDEASGRTSDCRSLSEARFSTTDPYLFTGAERDAFEALRVQVRTARYGHDGYAYARLAAGTLDLVIENSLKPHDYNALIPVIRAAGGVVGNWRGKDDFTAGRIIAAATPDLFEQAVAMMEYAA